MAAPIHSYSNPSIQRVRAVASGREPDTLLLEGDRLVDDAVSAGLNLELLLVASDREARVAELRSSGMQPVLVEHFVLDRVSRLKHSPGIVALAEAPRVRDLEGMDSNPSNATGQAPLVVVAAGISDPVNLGALSRSAEAAGAAALVHVADCGVRLWNPRALRGSMGSLLRLPLYRAASRGDAAEKLMARGFQVVLPSVRRGMDYREFDWSGPIALWIDSETGEVDEVSREFSRVTIPMAGAVDSLNVTVASSVLLFAANRR